MTTTSEREIRRANNFGLLRLAFSLMVIVSHSPELIDGNRSREPLNLALGTTSLGTCAVYGFFLLSGYLITQSYLSSDTLANYCLKRAVRIYPAFLASFIFCVLIIAPLAGGDIGGISATSWLRSVFLLGPKVPGAFVGLPNPFLNGSIWTVPYEVACYGLLPILMLFCSERTLGFTTTLMMLVLSCASLSATAMHVPKVALSFELFTAFVSGCFFFAHRDRILFSATGAFIAALLLFLSLLTPITVCAGLCMFGGYLIFWAAFCLPTSVLSRFCDRTDLSYGTYLYAWPIQSLLILKVPDISPWEVTFAAVPLSLGMAFLSWNFVEKPALALKNALRHAKVTSTGSSSGLL